MTFTSNDLQAAIGHEVDDLEILSHSAWHGGNTEPPVSTLSHRAIKTLCGKFAPQNHVVDYDDMPTCPTCQSKRR